jgi:hypothetical protein
MFYLVLIHYPNVRIYNTSINKGFGIGFPYGYTGDGDGDGYPFGLGNGNNYTFEMFRLKFLHNPKSLSIYKNPI